MLSWCPCGLQIADQGGGIPRSQKDMLFNYLYSTAPRPEPTDLGESAPLAGYGYGLPLSRVYARYFQGDLQLYSADGYGTDAMVYLKVPWYIALTELLPFLEKNIRNCLPEV